MHTHTPLSIHLGKRNAIITFWSCESIQGAGLGEGYDLKRRCMALENPKHCLSLHWLYSTQTLCGVYYYGTNVIESLVEHMYHGLLGFVFLCIQPLVNIFYLKSGQGRDSIDVFKQSYFSLCGVYFN